MIITTHIDLSADAYGYFVRLAEQMDGATPEELISSFLETYVNSIETT